MGLLGADPNSVPRSTRGGAPRMLMAIVLVVHDDDPTDRKVDIRPINNRAVKIGVPVPGWYLPQAGDRVLVAYLDGLGMVPRIVQYMAAADGSVAPRADFSPRSGDRWLLVGTTGQPAFEGGYANDVALPLRPALGYYLDALGFVNVRGNVAPGNDGTIFHLPVGFRPSFQHEFPALCGGGLTGACALSVLADGAVALVGAGATARAQFHVRFTRD